MIFHPFTWSMDIFTCDLYFLQEAYIGPFVFLFFVFFGGASDGTQGFVNANQALYRLNYSPSPWALFFDPPCRVCLLTGELRPFICTIIIVRYVLLLVNLIYF